MELYFPLRLPNRLRWMDVQDMEIPWEDLPHGELDEFLLDELALRLVFLLLGCELLLFFGRQVFVLGLVLELLDLVALVDDCFDDVVTERAPALDALYGGRCLRVVKDAA